MRDRGRRHRQDLDDVLAAFDETACRWVAYHKVLAAVRAGWLPADEETSMALWELELATDHWRERFLAALDRRGIPLDWLLTAA